MLRILTKLLKRAIDALLPDSLHDLIGALSDMLRLLTAWLRRVQEPDGLYEVLNYRATVELLDAKGRDAIYEKRERVRFLRDCPSGFYDYAWGDGRTFASHRVTPGRIVDRQPLGPRFRSLIALATPKRRGEGFSFTVRRRIMDGFLRPEQWWLEAEVNHKMEQISLAVTFPTTRPAQRAWLSRQQRQDWQPLETGRRLPDGRQIVRFTVSKPEIGERLTLGWQW